MSLIQRVILPLDEMLKCRDMADVSSIAISPVLIYLVFKVKFGLDSLKFLSTELFIPAKFTEKASFSENAQILAIPDS